MDSESHPRTKKKKILREAVDGEASVQVSLHDDDDLPHGSKQEKRSTSKSDQTIAEHNKKRKHRAPSPTNPQDPTSIVPDLNDGQDRTDISLKKVENSELENFLNELENDGNVRRICKLLLQKMIDREEDEREKQEMEYVLGEVTGFWLENAGWKNQITEDFCRTRIRKWVSDRLPPPSPVRNVKFEKTNGKLIVTWTSPDWPFSLHYSGECVESGGTKRVVDQFQNIAKTSYELSNVSPIRGYYVTVWAVDQKGQKGEENRTDRTPPPPVRSIKFEKIKGKLIVTWTSPKWPLPLGYSGECVESGGKKSVVDQFQNIAETSYELSNVSPIRGYYVTVWAVNQNGQKGEENREYLSLKMVENSELENFLNDLKKDPDVNRNCSRMLEKMMDQEEDEREKQEMMTVVKELLGFWTSNQITKDFCKTRIRKWVTDGKYPPPPVKDVEFEKTNGKLIVTWKSPMWPFAPRYCGECVESGGKKSVVEQFQNIAETSYELSNVSPIHGYYVTVWAVNQKGQKGEEGKSERGILCKRHGDIFVDHTSRLRPQYNVYKGYLKCASKVLDAVAVKIIHAMANEKTLREVKALQKLKHKNIVTYRLSKEFDDRYDEKSIVIAMELCCTDTFQELVADNKLNMHCCKISLLHMMLGLAAIHEAGFLHRDFKPQNILRSLDGEDMKVADFGLCKEMDPNKSKITKSVLEVGTEGWGSPEHYEPVAKMSEKSDIYSGGLVAAFGLSEGKHVYGSDPDYWKLSIKRGFEMDLSILACDNAEIAKDMISKMLQRDPANRPTAKQVLAHPFFWDDDKKLNFLHQMHLFFAPAISDLKKNVAPQQQTMTVMQDLDTKKSIFKTKQGEANWVKKMEDTPGVRSSYEHVLLTAKGLVPPKTKYDHTSVVHLIRFIRNVATHYREKKEFLKEFNDNRSNVWKLFYKCFPTLFCTVYNAVYKHFPQIGNCRDFPNDATRFFTEPAHYQPLPIP